MSETQANTPPPTVLVIDDSPDVHRLLHARLRHEQVDLHSAFSGEEGLETIKTLDPALVLLDLDMPQVDGFEVLRAIKDDPQTVDVPVIVLSGLTESTDKVTAFDLGAVDYIIKPFDIMELRVRIRSAIRIHTLVKLLAEKAHIDGLTGLLNRQAFDENWARSTAGNLRHATPLALALFDLDHFKSLNDTFGHPAGDDALRVFAALLAKECRQTDIPCRYGGEEFAVIMPETSTEDARAVCERIGAVLRDRTWPAHPERKVTVSIGVAGASARASLEAGAWIEASDKALYAAKKGGRDRVHAVDITADTARIARAG